MNDDPTPQIPARLAMREWCEKAIAGAAVADPAQPLLDWGAAHPEEAMLFIALTAQAGSLLEGELAFSGMAALGAQSTLGGRLPFSASVRMIPQEAGAELASVSWGWDFESAAAWAAPEPACDFGQLAISAVLRAAANRLQAHGPAPGAEFMGWDRRHPVRMRVDGAMVLEFNAWAFGRLTLPMGAPWPALGVRSLLAMQRDDLRACAAQAAQDRERPRFAGAL